MIYCEICNHDEAYYFYTIDNYSYFLCSNCQTLFIHPKPNHNKIVNHYVSDFNYDAGFVNEKVIRQRSKKIVKNLKKMNPQGKSLLDIGSGWGFFLNEADKSNLITTGIEPSKQLSYYSQSKLHLNVINSTLEDYNNEGKKFDFITFIHTLEHVYYPKKTLHLINNLLDENGILYIETPNLKSHLFNFERQNYTFLIPPDHLWIFSKKSVSLILKKNLLKVIRTSTYSEPEHFMGILKSLIKNRKSYIADNNKTAVKKQISFSKKIKYLIFDKLVARLFYNLLNYFDKGSILELYIKKKSSNC